MKNTLLAVSLLVSSLAFAQANPFDKPSTLPFNAPPFDKITDADYQPAIEAGMKEELVEIEKIANNPAPPTFANTIEAMEKSGRLLARASRVFFSMSSSNTNPTIRKVQAELAPKLAAHRDAINLNSKLFARVKTIYDKRAKLGLSPEAAFLVKRTYEDFVRSGAQLSDADKEKLKALNKESSTLTNQFRDKVLADTNASAIVIDDKAMLDGLPESDIAAAAQKAKDRGMEGKYILTLQNTTQNWTFATSQSASGLAFSSAESSVAASWIEEADVVVIPTTADPTALLGVIEYMEVESVREAIGRQDRGRGQGCASQRRFGTYDHSPDLAGFLAVMEEDRGHAARWVR